jgi:hypothetical protein
MLGGLQIQSYGRDMLYAVNYWADSHDCQCQRQVCVVGSPVVSATHQNGGLFRSKSRLCQWGEVLIALDVSCLMLHALYTNLAVC